MVIPSLFILASSVCKSLQCLISTLTQRDKCGHLFRPTCSVVLWERDTTNKYHWHVWGMLATHGPHWVYHSPRWHVLPRSTLLRLQGALQMYSVEWTLFFMLFPGLRCSRSQVLCKGTDSDGLCIWCPSQVQAAQATGAWRALFQVDLAFYAPSWSQPLGFSGVPCVSSGELISGCDPPGRCEPSRIPGIYG